MSTADQNIKQSVLQTIMTKQFYTRDELADYLNKYDIDFNAFILESNEKLASLGYEIRKVISDYNGIEYYGFCPTFEDSFASEGLIFKADVVQLFYRFLNMVIEATLNHESSILIGQILDSTPPDHTQIQTQEGLKQLQEYGYVEFRGDRVRLGPRGLLEFRPTFSKIESKDDSQEIQSCTICLDFLLAGMKCSKCSTFMHRHCYNHYISNRDGPVICPVCKNPGDFVEFGM